MKKQILTEAIRRARPAVFVLLGAFLVFSGGGPARAQTKATPNKSGAADPVLIDLQGYQKLLEKHRGKPLLVNFWATWCEPCREEFPMLNELAQAYAQQGLAVMGVTLDADVDINLVRRFLARMHPVFPNFRKKSGKDQEFIDGVDAKWSGALPATFFYDRDSRMKASLVGEHRRAEFETNIQQLLSGSAPAAAGPARKSAP